MSDFDDYKQRMKEKFEQNQGQKGGLTQQLSKMFQSKENKEEIPQQNEQISDFELAKRLQEAELQKNSNPNQANVYDFRGGNNIFQPPPGGVIYQSPVQQIPRGASVELNDYSSPQNRNKMNYVALNENNNAENEESSGLLAFIKNKIEEEMTPTTKIFCYFNVAVLFIIIIILFKSV